MGAAGLEGVEADPRDDGGEPATEVLHIAGIGAAEADPRLLHGVVGFGMGAEHAVGNLAQADSELLETLRQPIGIGHGHNPPLWMVYTYRPAIRRRCDPACTRRRK